MHAIVRFKWDLPATHMIHILDQAEQFGVWAQWEELDTVEEDGRLWPEVDIEWDDEQTEMARIWLDSSGIARVFVEDEE